MGGYDDEARVQKHGDEGYCLILLNEVGLLGSRYGERRNESCKLSKMVLFCACGEVGKEVVYEIESDTMVGLTNTGVRCFTSGDERMGAVGFLNG